MNSIGNNPNGTDYILFEAGSIKEPRGRSAEAVFWKCNLLPATVKLVLCFGNTQMAERLRHSVNPECKPNDRVFLVFDNANMWKYNKDGNLVPRSESLDIYRGILSAVAHCPAPCFRCVSLSFEALLLSTGLLSSIAQLREQHYLQLGNHASRDNIRLLRERYLTSIPSLTIQHNPAMMQYLMSLFSSVSKDIFSTNKKPGPETSLYRLVNACTRDTEFQVQKNKIGPCWRDACENVKKCWGKIAVECPRLCEPVNHNTEDARDTLAWKEKVIKEGLGISDFTDLFEEILK